MANPSDLCWATVCRPGLCILPSRYGGSSLAVGLASLRLLLCYGGAQRGNGWGAVWLFTAMRGLRAVAQGVSAPGVPWIPAAGLCSGMLPSSCGVRVPLRLSKSTRFSLAHGHQLQGPNHRSYCPGSLVSSTPCPVSALWCRWLELGVQQSWAPSPSPL